MASGTVITPAIGLDQVKMRWREPYVTEGLNKKSAGITPRGCYRGFRLAYNGAPMLVSVLSDPVKGDHIVQYETDTGAATRYGLRVELTAGDFTIDLDNVAWYGLTVYVAIYAEYTTLATTAANIRVYTEAEYNGAVEKDELVILGKVNVPGVISIIPDADITGNERTLPWANQSSDARPWLPLLANPSFEQGGIWDGVQGDVVPDWLLNPMGSGGNMQWNVVNTDASVGANCLEVEANTTSSSGVYAASIFALSVLPAQRIRWKFSYKIVAAASTGSLTFNFVFNTGEPGGPSTVVVVSTVDLTAAPGSWVELEGVVEVPTGTYVLNEVYFDCAPIQYSGTGIGFRLDGVQCWVERDEMQAAPLDAKRIAEVRVGKLILHEAATLNPANSWEVVGSYAGVTLQRTDHDVTATQPELNLPGNLIYARAAGFSQALPAIYRPNCTVGGFTTFDTQVYMAGNLYSWRRYYGAIEEVVDSLNAANTYASTNYVADDAAQDALKWWWASSGLRLVGAQQPHGATIAWAETIQLRFLTSGGGGPTGRQGALHLDDEPLTGSIPDWDASRFYAKIGGLYTRNTCKMWAKLRDNGGGVGIPSVHSGFNVDLLGTAPVIAGGAIRVYPQDAFASGFVLSAVSNCLSTAYYSTAQPDPAGLYVDVFITNPTTGLVVAMGNLTEDVDVHVYGVLA